MSIEEVFSRVTACEAQVIEIRAMMDTTHRILMDKWDGVRDTAGDTTQVERE